MTVPRTPWVIGLHAGTGTTTVATALHARDGGSSAAAADLVVCASTEESLLRAETLAVGAARPWLAVVMVQPGQAPARGRLRHAARRCAGFTLLPHVGHWAGLTRPIDDLPVLLGFRPDQLPQTVRAYAAGLRAIATGLARTGLLDQARPPVVAAQLEAQPRLVLRAVRSDRPALRPTTPCPTATRHPAALPACWPTRARTGPMSGTPVDLIDLDDDALERAVQLIGTR